MSTIGRISRGEANIDFIGRSKLWFGLSGGVLVLSLIGLLGTKLNLGQEFTGGTSLRVTTTSTVTVAEVEDALAPFALEDVKVQLRSGADPDRPGAELQEILVRSAHIADQETFDGVIDAMATVAGRTDAAGDPDVDAVGIEDVGPTWGRQVSSKALQGLIIFLILVSIYISVRFEWKMAAGALAALFHDLVATAGIYALVGFIVTPATVIALLTLLGYSLYDTVVVFDKVRENTDQITAGGKTTYSAMVNLSANQVLMRSINTSLSTLLPIGSLLFVGVFAFGAETLKDLALAMFIGTIVGTYSSIFVAIPILALLKEREPRYRALRARMEERAARGAAPEQGAVAERPDAAPVPAAEEPPTTPDEVPASRPRPARPVRRTGPARGRKRRGGKRRR